MKNILDKIAELPSGENLLVNSNWGPTGFSTDDLKALASHLKRMESLMDQVEVFELKDGDTIFGGEHYWKVDSQTPGDDSPNPEYPDALTAFESLKEQK